MARQSKRRKFSNNQIVVFRFGDKKLVGKIALVRPVGKKFIYDVLCEDGKIYSELPVDVAVNESIDTYLTKLFYQKYNIDPNAIPEVIEDEPELTAAAVIEPVIDETIVEEDETVFDEEEVLFTDDEESSDY